MSLLLRGGNGVMSAQKKQCPPQIPQRSSLQSFIPASFSLTQYSTTDALYIIRALLFHFNSIKTPAFHCPSIARTFSATEKAEKKLQFYVLNQEEKL
jgi:hypothetical protein